MDFFTWQMLATVAGATAATVLIVDVARAAFGFSARWLALVVAAVVSLAVWVVVGDYTVNTGLLALLNTFVVYAAATGSQAVIGGIGKTPQDAVRDAMPIDNANWRAPWW